MLILRDLCVCVCCTMTYHRQMQFILEFQDSLKHVTHQHIELMILNESFFLCLVGWLGLFGYSDIVTKRGRCNCYIEYLVIHLIGLHNNFRGIYGQ